MNALGRLGHALATAAKSVETPAGSRSAVAALATVDRGRSFSEFVGGGSSLHSRVAIRDAESRRSIVSERMFKALTGLPDGKAAVKSFQFQIYGDCFATSEAMRQGIVRSRADASGVVQQPGTAKRVLEGERFTAKGLMHLNSHHGPVMLWMYKLVQDDQGGETYARKHGAVLVSHFHDHKGRNIGVLLDGNDLQSNPTMTQIKGWMEKQGIESLYELGEAQFTQMKKDLGYDVRRTGFRLVDLDSLVAAAQKRAAFERDTNKAFCNIALRFDPPLMPTQRLAALRKAIAEDSEMVESFS